MHSHTHVTHISKHAKAERILLIAIGVTLLFGIIKWVGADDLGTTIQSLNPIYLMFIIDTELLIFFLWNLKWQTLVEEVKPISFGKLFPVFLSGLIVNNLTPGPSAGGEPVKAYFLTKINKKPFASNLATVVMDGAVHIAVLFGVAIFSILYVIFFMDVPRTALFLKGLLGFIFSMAMIGLYLERERSRPGFEGKMDRFLHWSYKTRFLHNYLENKFSTFVKFRSYVHKQYFGFKYMFLKLWEDKPRLAKVGLIAIAILFFEGSKMYFVFFGLGVPISFFNVLVVNVIAGMVGYFILVPGGTGAYEAVAIALYTAIGVPLVAATAATLIFRVMFYIMTYGVGFVSLTWLHHKYHGDE